MFFYSLKYNGTETNQSFKYAMDGVIFLLHSINIHGQDMVRSSGQGWLEIDFHPKKLCQRQSGLFSVCSIIYSRRKDMIRMIIFQRAVLCIIEIISTKKQ